MGPALDIYRIARAGADDLPKIERLLGRNHKDNLTAQERGQGYLSLRIGAPLLERIQAQIGIVVARLEAQVVGFEIPLAREHRQALLGETDPIRPMLQRIHYAGRQLDEYRLVSGQYCVDAQHRGQGIPVEMHAQFLEMLRPDYELLVFAISATNPRSYEVATRKLGMQEAGRDETIGWRILVQDLRA